MFLSAATNYGSDWLPALKLTKPPNDFTMCGATPPQLPNGPNPHPVSTGGATLGNAVSNTASNLSPVIEERERRN